MTAHTLSPVLIGRGDELRALAQAFDAVRDGVPEVVFVGGEAGVGKTRFVEEFVRHAAPAQVLVGACLELSTEALPFAPFSEALRDLVRRIGAAGVTKLMPPGSSGVLGRLLPEFGAPDDTGAGEARARLFEVVLTVMERLAASGPVVLVIEDAHWADRSTRDLLTFLIRNLGPTVPLMIVVTYRTNELHQAHPLRRLLPELERLDRVRRIELSRLGRAEVQEMVRLARGQESFGLAERIFQRSEGNPLFVEALLGDSEGLGDSGLPESLRDLLLAAVQRLPEETQEVLRAASVENDQIEHRLLTMVTGLDDVALTRSLRPAVEGNVLLVRGDGYTFRHALIREAIHEDLLPGERIGLHVRYAAALAGDPALRPGRRALSLAHHWFAAHDITRALVSAWDAVAETRAGLAYAEALRMASRVLELWERVPDAAALIGASRGEVLQEAVDLASLSGEAKLGIRLATAALEEVTDPERAAYLLRRRGTLAMELGRNDGMDDLRAAADRAPADPPNAERARALAALAMQFGSVRAMDGVADQIIKEGLAIARAVGDTTTEISLEMNVSWQRLFRDGDMQAHIAAIRALRARAVELGSFEQLLRSFINESDVLEMYGRHAEAAEVARQGRARAEEYGLGRTAGTLLAVNLAEPLVSLGQWDEALTIVAEELAREPSGVLQANLRYVAAEILIARGELDRAVPLIAAAPRLVGHGVASKAQNLFPVCRVQAQLRLAQGDPEGTFEALRPVFEETGLPNESRYALPALMVAATACVALGGRALGNGASGGRALSGGGYAEEIRARVDGLRIYGPEQAAYRLTTLAEVRRAEGVLDRGAWNEAVRLWEELQRPYDLAFALVRAADAASAEGDRDRAAALLRRAAGLSDRLGTPLLREEIDLLARRARISLSGARPVLGPGLTPRETEVLRLLAEGRSNREIADALFISAKTASVHVSNILGKLNVSTRGEAAALAHRLHLTLDP